MKHLRTMELVEVMVAMRLGKGAERLTCLMGSPVEGLGG